MSKAAELANLIGNINAGGGGVNRNFIINGMMQINQRGDSTGITSGGYYACDRFKSDISGAGTWSIAQSTTVPSGKGFKNSVKLDCTTANGSLSSGAYFIYQTRIEGQDLQRLAFGTSDARPIVLSFYVKSNKTGTYHIGLYNTDNARMNGRTYTIDSADTWELKTISFDADTSQGFTDDNNASLLVEWWLAGGTDYTSGSTPTAWTTADNTIRAGGLAVNLADSTDNEWLLTGVQLEVGQNPTTFEHEPFERTLEKCQRYFYRIGDGASRTGFATTAGHTSTAGFGIMHFPVTMRATPSLTKDGSNSDYYLTGNGQRNITSLGSEGANKDGCTLVVGVSSITVGDSFWFNNANTNGTISFNAEL